MTPRIDRWPAVIGRIAVMVMLVVLSGCSGGSLQLLPPSQPDEAELWQLPADAYPSQRLYRVKYQGPEGKASFRLTLYLAEPSRYRMDAADTLGRRVWSLQVDGDTRAVFLDHRRSLYCTAAGGGEQSFVPIAHLPLAALPHLILARIPAIPAGELSQNEPKVSFRDGRGRLWNAEASEGALSWWSLMQGGEAVAWWRRLDDRFVFSDRRGGQQVTWSEQVRERLGKELAPLEIPRDFREGACGETLVTQSGA